MPVFLLNLFGNASVGVYSLTTERIAIIPLQVPKAISQKLKEWLNVKVIHTTIGGSVLIGVLACANSNGMILPYFVNEEEIKTIKSALDINVAIMETNETAFGNLVLGNDHGAVIGDGLKQRELRKISDTLGVEVVPGEIAGLPYVGSLAVATNKGVLTHPSLKEEERKLLMDVLKARVHVGTVNNGIPYVSSGLIGNNSGVVTGFTTTGPELFVIGQALDVV